MNSIQMLRHPIIGGLVGCLICVSVEGMRPFAGFAQAMAPMSDGTSIPNSFQETGRGTSWLHETALTTSHILPKSQHVQGMDILLADANALSLETGFTPNPMVLRGTGGGDRQAAEVVNTQHTSTGPCLGFISSNPHEEITLENSFANLEMSVESASDTTLVISGPGGVWCNDDSHGRNPAITGEWLPGSYRVWVGSYTSSDEPTYELSISDRS